MEQEWRHDGDTWLLPQASMSAQIDDKSDGPPHQVTAAGQRSGQPVFVIPCRASLVCQNGAVELAARSREGGSGDANGIIDYTHCPTSVVIAAPCRFASRSRYYFGLLAAMAAR